MKIRREYRKKEDISSFAEKYDLTMVVRERSDLRLPRFFAAFECADVKDGGFLVGVYGDGQTEDEAIADYAKDISGKFLAVQKPGCSRTDIICPDLEYKY